MFSIAFLIAFAADPAFRSPEDFLPAGAISRIGNAKLTRPMRPFERVFLTSDKSLAIFLTQSHPLARMETEWWDMRIGKRVPPPFVLPAGHNIVNVVQAGVIVRHQMGYQLRDLKSGNIRFEISEENCLLSSVPTFDASGSVAITRSEQKLSVVRKLSDGSNTTTELPLLLHGPWDMATRGLKIVWHQEREIKLYDLLTGITRTVVKLEFPYYRVTALAISPDGSAIAIVRSGEDRESPTLCHIFCGENFVCKEFSQDENKDILYKIEFSSDGKLLYAVDDESSRLWNVANGKMIDNSKMPYNTRLFPSADSKTLLRIKNNGCFSLIDWITKQEINPAVIRFSPFRMASWTDSRSAVGVNQPEFCFSDARENMRISRWDPTQQLGHVTWKQIASTEKWRPLTFSPDGHRIAVFPGDSNLSASRILNVSTGKIEADWVADGECNVAGPFSGDGQWILVRKNGRMRILSLDGARCLVTLNDTSLWPDENRPYEWYTAKVEFSPDGRFLYFLLGNVGFSAFEMATGRPRYTILKPSQNVRDRNNQHVFALSGDGRRAVIELNHRCSLIDPTIGKVLRTLDFPLPLGISSDHSVTSLSHRGRWFATSIFHSRDILIFDLEQTTPELIHTFRGATGSLNSLAFSPDDRYLLSASSDGTAITWDVGKVIREYLHRVATDPTAAWWGDLAGEAPRAGKAIAAMVEQYPARAVTMIGERLALPRAADATKIGRWIRDLDSDDPPVRESAFRELEGVFDQAEPHMRARLQTATGAEVRKKLASLLALIDDPVTDPNRLRNSRAVEVLERIGSADAKRLLTMVANGPPGAQLTREAKESLARLDGK